MQLTRRRFTTSMLGAAGAAALTPAVIARLLDGGAFFEWSKVADGAWVAQGGGGNALLVTSANEALLVDCKNFGLGPVLLDECTDKVGALTTVVNTHHHGDHVGGNPTVLAADIPLYAHGNAIPRLEGFSAQAKENIARAAPEQRQRAADRLREQGHTEEGGNRAAEGMLRAFEQVQSLSERAFVPTHTLGDDETLRVGDLTVRLRHIGPGHTDNDVFIVIPELDLMHTGDLCFHNLHPFIDMGAGASSAGWIANCDAMLDVCGASTTVVPGHGAVGGRAAIDGQKQYFTILRERMAQAHADGLSREDAVAITINAFADYGFEQIRERTYGSVYDEMG